MGNRETKEVGVGVAVQVEVETEILVKGVRSLSAGRQNKSDLHNITAFDYALTENKPTN